ncbi:hypothetical protein FXO37_06398 [Capsicum annuum]|nr:hypothetical protein FXO37_06398 [Capsicum annuum]
MHATDGERGASYQFKYSLALSVMGFFSLPMRMLGVHVGDEGRQSCKGLKHPARADSLVVKHFCGSFCYVGFDNDPSAAISQALSLKVNPNSLFGIKYPRDLKNKRRTLVRIYRGMIKGKIPFVCTSSELIVRRTGKALEGTIPSPSPRRPVMTRSCLRNNSGSPPITNGFRTRTPMPSPQSQSFCQSCGSILPTSLVYIIPSNRGCSPWRPDVAMITIERGWHSALQIFKGHQNCTKHHVMCNALTATGPYLQLSRFQSG